MLRYREYPLGDIQTWIEYNASNPTEDKDLLMKFFDEEFSNLMLSNGIRNIEEKNGYLKFRDTISGLPYIYVDNDLRLDMESINFQDFEVINTCFYRNSLLKGFRPGVYLTNLWTESALDRYGLDQLDYLASPIVSYEVTSKSELTEVIHTVEDKLSRGPYFNKIWLRGQRQEYKITRNKDICNFLGFGSSGIEQPSILPSLGRYAIDNPSLITEEFARSGPNHFWKKPFIIWIIRNNPEWLSHYPSFMERLENSLRCSDDMEFSRLLLEVRLDPEVPATISDLTQRFFTTYKYSNWIFVLQQYGYKTSMLDLTWDIDTALFFTHTKMVNNHFEFVSPTCERIIYLFAEPRENYSFKSAKDIVWGDNMENCQIPPRIASQNCGILYGSSIIRKYFYSHLVVAKIRILNNDVISDRTIDEVFPPINQDLLYKTLMQSNPIPEGLY